MTTVGLILLALLAVGALVWLRQVHRYLQATPEPTGRSDTHVAAGRHQYTP